MITVTDEQAEVMCAPLELGAGVNSIQTMIQSGGNCSLSENLGIYPQRGIGADQLKQYMFTTFHLLAAYGLHGSSYVSFLKFLFIIMQLSPHKT